MLRRFSFFAFQCCALPMDLAPTRAIIALRRAATIKSSRPFLGYSVLQCKPPRHSPRRRKSAVIPH
jgi:hypothetical protein